MLLRTLITPLGRKLSRMLGLLLLVLGCLLSGGASADSSLDVDTPRPPPPPQNPPPTCPAWDNSVFPYDLPSTATAAAGAIAGSFSVSPAGDATYALSLDVPPGRNGMQPSIEIAYDSAHGDGVLGMGFSITGLSAITRCARTMLQDGRVGGVTYGQADALCLDGQHLVMTQGLVPDPQHPFAPQNCTAPGCYEYRTQPDSFVRVLARYENGLPVEDGPHYFDVFTKSGLHLVYGDAPGKGGNANVLALNAANAAWWIAQSSDRDGNTIDYDYWNDLASIPWPSPPSLRFYTAEIAPKQISYTGHPTVTATRAISFVYDTKDPKDVRTHYDHGAPLISARRLTSIQMSEGQTGLRRYDFTYALGPNTHRTLLQQVKECSWDMQPVCKPPTIFTWSQAPLGFGGPLATALPAPESSYASVMPMDLNGDGLPDLVVPDVPTVGDTSWNPSTTLWNVALNKGPLHPDADHSPYFSSPFTVAANAPIPPPAQPGAPVLPELGSPLDYNQDGLTDILMHDIHGQHANWMVLVTSPPAPNKPKYTFQPMDTGIPRVFGLGVDTPPRLAGASASAHLADLDGDGVSDLIQCEEVGVGTFSWTVNLWDPAGGFSAIAHPLPPLSVIYPCDTELYPVDVDNDGVIDLVLRETDQDPMGGAVPLNNYITFSLVVASVVNPSFDLWTSLDLHLPVPPIGGALFWMDVNGDGLPDVVQTGFANHLPLTFLNTGDPNIMFAPSYWSMAADPTIDAPDALASLGTPLDYNGDGLQDLLLPVRMNGSNAPPSWVVLETSKQDPSDPASPWIFVPVVTSIPFDAQATLDAVGKAKISLWDPHGPRVLDVDGDGAHDVLLPINGFFNVFRNKASDQDLLIAVADGHNEHDPGEPGFDPTVELTYEHLIDLSRTDGVSPGSPAVEGYRYVSRYDPTNGCAYPRVCSVGPQRVVATYTLNADVSPKGLTRWRAYAVQYRDSRYHRIARRSLGFGRRIVSDLQTGAGVEEIYDNITSGLDPGFPVPFAGHVTEERRWNPGLPTQPSPQQIEISSTTITLHEVVTQAGSNHFVIPALREVRSIEGTLPPNVSALAYVRANVGPNPPSATVLSDTTRTIVTFDGAGNTLLESSSAAGVALTSTVERQITMDPFTGLTSEVTDVHDCSAIPGLQQCRTLHRTLDPALGHVITETQQSDDPSEVQETQTTTTFGYDLFGNVTTVSAVDADGDTRSACISYFPNGFPFAHVNPAGHVVYTKYHPGYGVLLASVDANGLVTQWAHDGLGRVTEELRPDQTSTTTTLSRVKDMQQGGVYRLQIETKTTGGEDDIVWQDSLGRTVKTWRQGVQTWPLVPPRIVQAIRYDLLSGHVAGRSVPTDENTFDQQGAAEDTYDYDAAGRMVKHTSPWGAVTTYTHSGLTVTVTDPRQHQTVTTLDALGRTSSIQNAKGEVTTYGYGPFGGLWTVTAPDMTATKVLRDAFGRAKHRDDPDRGAITLRHDGFGQIRESTDALNRKVSMTYDPLGRPLERVDVDGITRWKWDTAPMGNGKVALGRIAEVTSPGGAIKSYTYDNLARSAEGKLTVDGESFSAATGYDGFGRLSTVTYPSSPNVAPLVVMYGYDDHGHMLTAKDASTGLAYWTLTDTDGAGRITGEQFGNKVRTAREYYDEKNRVKSIRTANDLGASLQELTYTYDDNLNLSDRADGLAGANGIETLLYDELDRVSCAKLSGLPGCQQAWSYEPSGSGNVHSASGVGVYTYDPQHPHAVHTAGPDVFTYNAVGNQITRSGMSLEYTAFDKPSKITLPVNLATVVLDYDGDQQRIRKKTADEVAVYLDDLYERVTHTSTGVVEHRYTIHGSERAVAIVSREEAGPSTMLYAHVDHLGSVDALSDDQGKLVEKRSYDAFGARRNPDWGKPPPPSFSSLTPHGFTWHEGDDEIGLVNMRGRMYDPKVGRFLTADPIMGDPGAGEQWNPYGYVGNNPLTYIDPSGFDAEPAGPPPAGCEAFPQLCAFNGKWVSPIVVTVHRTNPPEPPPKPKEEAIEAGAALVPTDVGTAGTAVGFVPTPDATAPKSAGERVGRFALGMGKAYVGQVLETVKSIMLNVATVGGYSIFKTWWSIGEGIAEGIERHDFGEAGWQVGLSGAMRGINAVNPVWGLIVTGIHGVEAVHQGDDEKLGAAVEPVLVAIIGTVAAGRAVGAEAGAEAAEATGPELRSVSPRSLIPTEPLASKSQAGKMSKLMGGEKGFGPFDPIDVVESGGKLYIVDGHHRAAAAAQARVPEVPVRVRPPVSPQEAQDLFRGAASTLDDKGF